MLRLTQVRVVSLSGKRASLAFPSIRQRVVIGDVDLLIIVGSLGRRIVARAEGYGPVDKVELQGRLSLVDGPDMAAE